MVGPDFFLKFLKINKEDSFGLLPDRNVNIALAGPYFGDVVGIEVKAERLDRTGVDFEYGSSAESVVSHPVPVKYLVRVLLEKTPLLRQCHGTALPCEKFLAELSLEFGDILAHGRLRNTQLPGRNGEVAAALQCFKNLQPEVLKHTINGKAFFFV